MARMDPVTQSALGASLAQTKSKPNKVWAAAILGCIGGLAPDLDVLISSSKDPLLFLEYHRQFTHSLIFIPFGSLIVSLFCWKLFKHGLTFKEVYLFCFLGYATHGLLDACTTYGTLLLWPFSDTRFAWNNISIIDPLLTLPLLTFVILSIARKTNFFSRVAVTWVILYLMVGLIQRDRAIEAGKELALKRSHNPTRLEAKPSFGNILLWKIVYEQEDFFYVDAVRVGITPRVYEGTKAEKLDLDKHFPWLEIGSQQRKDINRFHWFSNNYLGIDQKNENKIIDIRYSMLPDEIDALWGIELSETASREEHVKWVTSREMNAKDIEKFWSMLF